MTKIYITVDGGTTNTRISLVQSGKITDTLKYGVGAGKGIEDKNILARTVREGISEILARGGLKESDVCRVLASGMITSELGIYRLDHTTLPVGIKELSEAKAEVRLPEISDIPFVFMRGVKTGDKELRGSDMMRGEETELMGIMKASDGACVYILPGSHSKIISTDESGRITDFSTMMTGEMIASLWSGTILRDAFDLKKASLDRKYLLEGFDFCRENGINRALFKVRVLKNLFRATEDEAYSFFIGAVLCGEIIEVVKLSPRKVVVGGKKQIKDATCEILGKITDCEIARVPDEIADTAASVGMVRIFEYDAAE